MSEQEVRDAMDAAAREQEALQQQPHGVDFSAESTQQPQIGDPIHDGRSV